ncbi:sulfotransferase [Halomonas sp. ATCH28]|uniref:Sulfotransferase n=1 Tax=Halomonas gemina TaxID=2945105 RepID=A0ABT0SXF3_9GAMM|nr:sulfotransferase [Halomonas gemina]MCL7939346.1 sulfotransferase [Halomonas gemina]
MTLLLTLIEGVGLYVAWWLRSLIAWRDPRAPMTLRRFIVLLLGMPIFLLVQLVHATCLLLDELLFPSYRKIAIKRPLFITGIPRSGTTFLHRTLAVDGERYTTLTTWEALLAPSIVQRRIIQGLARIDGLLGGPGRRILGVLTRRLAGRLTEIHEVGLEAAEEDYLALLPAAGCFILLLAFPGAIGLQRLGHLDRQMPCNRRQRLLRFYRSCLQRHLYSDGGRRFLLSKNAAFGSWITGLQAICPDARFILCIREPLAALSSQISSIDSARALFGTAVNSEALQRLFAHQFAETLEHMAATVPNSPTNRIAVVDMADLGADPATVIPATLVRLDIPVSQALMVHLAMLPRRQPSRHQHSVDRLALPSGELEQRLYPPYHRLADLPHRTRIAT